MRDHRFDDEGKPIQPILSDITKAVQQHHTNHPGSVKRSDKAQVRAAAKRAKASRKGNR